VKQDIRAVTLGVQSLERSRTFYSDGLGWEPLLDLPEITFYQGGHGLLFALWPLTDLQEDVGHSLSRANSFSLGHNVESAEEVKAIIERARSAGGTILKEPQPAPLFNGYQGYFADPDGYIWDVVHNPGLVVEEDGTLVFRTP
jgi:uncharacterized protein